MNDDFEMGLAVGIRDTLRALDVLSIDGGEALALAAQSIAEAKARLDASDPARVAEMLIMLMTH